MLANTGCPVYIRWSNVSSLWQWYDRHVVSKRLNIFCEGWQIPRVSANSVINSAVILQLQNSTSLLYKPVVFLSFVGPTFNRWHTVVVSGTWKYDEPEVENVTLGAARVWHFQLRVVLFPCPTNDCVSYVLSYGQLQESWIISGLQWQNVNEYRLPSKNAHSRTVRVQ